MQQGLSGARAEYPSAAIRRGASGSTVQALVGTGLLVQALYLYKIMMSQMMHISIIVQLKISAD
ncbi:hypothetical protein JK229_12085 [Pantoea dispersa]|uniref:hypothetical protein n=1 Tax=Pantoea dispersa TaxID=59814 RepID=UPI001BADC5EC|nr:hypothetical protein [Pantoea dispersa]MBS0905866.1 hypothetical protein [Pantoea dispersa]